MGQDVSSPGEFLAGFKSSLFEETIFVLTPQGKIIDLPRTPPRSISPMPVHIAVLAIAAAVPRSTA